MTAPLAPPILRWSVREAPPDAAVNALAAALSLPRPLAALLIQRGYGEAESARRFLRPSLGDLTDPYDMAGMDAAVREIVSAVQDGRTILVHGDYDVDGQCAATMLTRVLREAGANVHGFVPHRLRDGYDFGPAGVAEAARVGASLIITCDCGINAVDTVRQARDAGIDVIVTDHHLPGPVLPDAVAVIDPQRADDTSTSGILSGTGVAFKLVQALTPALGLPEALPMHFLDIVALATVADLVPIIEENRILVRHGLRLMRNTRWAGLRALIQVSGLADREIRAGHLGYQIGPRLNAVGRIGDAIDGLRLLLTDDPVEAERLARHLNRLNEQRQAMDQQMLDQALEQMTGFPELEKMAGLVLAADGWHPGVVGIVASRVVERYGRPTFMIALEGEVGKGSGRSVRGFNLHDALTGCDDLLERYGGHAMAAGLTIRRENLPRFRERFAELAAAELGTEDVGPEQRVDLILNLSEATQELEKLCRYLEPCGMGNPTPVFGARDIRFEEPRRVGNGHLKGLFRMGDACLPVIGFSWADRAPWVSGGPVHAAFKLETNEYLGRVSLQARLMALGPCHTEPVASSQ